MREETWWPGWTRGRRWMVGRESRFSTKRKGAGIDFRYESERHERPSVVRHDIADRRRSRFDDIAASRGLDLGLVLGPVLGRAATRFGYLTTDSA